MCDTLYFAEEDIDEFNIHVSRYRPEELTKLTKITKFNKKEIQLIYRGFKQVCNDNICLFFFLRYIILEYLVIYPDLKPFLSDFRAIHYISFASSSMSFLTTYFGLIICCHNNKNFPKNTFLEVF